MLSLKLKLNDFEISKQIVEPAREKVESLVALPQKRQKSLKLIIKNLNQSQSIKSNLSLYSLNYTEALEEFAGPISALLHL